jgi:phage/plasmid-like protein (TIGR03299 family)
MNEQIFVDRTTTWHAIGKDVQECRNMEQVLRSSGLDYEVAKKPVFTSMIDGGTLVEVPNRFMTVNSNGKIYDVVSDKFQLVQNREAFEFVDYMGDELSFEKAGETGNGMVYVIGKLPSVNILGDEFTPHVIFRNGFSGKIKITAAICPLRLVCQNQFNFAFKDTQNTVSIRHVGNAEAKLQEARDVLKLSADYMQELNKMAEQYVGIKLTPAQVDKVLDQMFPITDRESINAFKLHQLEEARAKFTAAYNADDNSNFRGTGWGLVNAYTDFITHKPAMGKSETRDEGKFIVVTFHPAMMNAILSAVQAAR